MLTVNESLFKSLNQIFSSRVARFSANISLFFMRDPIVSNRNPAGLLFWLALSFAAESSAVMFLPGRWYAHLNKASWTPPSYLFGPVWTALYIVMAVAAWLVWRDGGFRKNPVPLSLYVAQLALNAAWSFVCFRLHNLPLSVADLILLWLMLLATTRAFFRSNRLRVGSFLGSSVKTSSIAVVSTNMGPR